MRREGVLGGQAHGSTLHVDGHLLGAQVLLGGRLQLTAPGAFTAQTWRMPLSVRGGVVGNLYPRGLGPTGEPPAAWMAATRKSRWAASTYANCTR